MSWRIECADVLDWAAGYEGPQFHAMLCDPPYHLIQDTRNGSMRQPGTGPYGRHKEGTKGFMNKTWDGGGIAFQPETWAALAAHLLPGAFVMAFGGSRTYHRLACALEDAGLIIHPAIVWVYGSGFPKATRILSREWEATDIPNPNHRESIGQWRAMEGRPDEQNNSRPTLTAPATPLAAIWAGHRYGLQALKPAAEFICVAQKPYAGKPVTSIVEMGAGALNIDSSRIEGAKGNGVWGTNQVNCQGTFNASPDNGNYHTEQHPGGRWPANFILSHLPGCRKVGTRRVQTAWSGNGQQKGTRHSDFGMGAGSVNKHTDPDGLELVDAWLCAAGCPVAALSAQSGERPSGGRGQDKHSETGWFGAGAHNGFNSHPSTGTAARFFFQATWEYEIAERLAGAEPFYYCAKSSRRERDAGLDGLDLVNGIIANTSGRRFNPLCNNTGKRIQVCNCGNCTWDEGTNPKVRNPHPTVKPIALTRYLATLLLPPPAYAPRRIVIPFGGVMSEAIGAGLAGWEEITAIEREPEYVEIGQARLRHWLANLQLELAL